VQNVKTSGDKHSLVVTQYRKLRPERLSFCHIIEGEFARKHNSGPNGFWSRKNCTKYSTPRIMLVPIIFGIREGLRKVLARTHHCRKPSMLRAHPTLDTYSLVELLKYKVNRQIAWLSLFKLEHRVPHPSRRLNRKRTVNHLGSTGPIGFTIQLIIYNFTRTHSDTNGTSNGF
jgi:hypothetical protein